MELLLPSPAPVTVDGTSAAAVGHLMGEGARTA